MGGLSMTTILKRLLILLLPALTALAALTGGGGELRAQTRALAQSGFGTMKIYMAGPLGFSEAGRYFYYRELVPAVMRLGYEILDPWKLTDQKDIDAVLALPYGMVRREAWRDLNVVIAGNNRKAIDACDGVFAVLDGVDVDSGTAAEIGYAFAKGKPIIGYRGDFRLSADNEGSIVNLQVEYFIRQSGGTIIAKTDEIPGAFDKLKAVMRSR
jgi:nucleoside 2-deoxyribosyltransferase